ncbi:hypothetical protein BDQ17DRAFT_1415010 [Cyathus striatus]|nr:hypothetical protein BDQ17DRAFT_1415010 [Cyathus striatus]
MSNTEINFNAVLSSRYFSAATCVCVIWDHIINFDQEIELIWKTRRGTMLRKIWPKLNAIVHRYIMEGILVLNAIVLSGTAPYILQAVYMDLRSFRDSVRCYYPVAEVTLIMRLYTSWDEGKVSKYMVVTVSALASLLLMAFLVTFVHEAQGTRRNSIYFTPLLHTCLFDVTRLPRALVYVHSAVLSFHVLVLGLVAYKVLETPRRTNIEVLHKLQIDGFKSFMLLFLINVMGLVLSINGNPKYQIYLTGVLLSSMTIVNSRIYLRLEALRNYKHPGIASGWEWD